MVFATTRYPRKMQIDLMGRVALVTGGSGQLGRVMCRTLAACGAHLAVHYHHNEEQAAQIVAAIRASGGRAQAVQADVTDPSQVRALRGQVEAALGAVDVLVNNAVIQYRWTSVLEQAVTDFTGQFQSSTLHNVLMAQTFVPAMQQRRWGRVIGINTECAMQCLPGQGAYVAGKRGMDGVLRVLAREVGAAGVTVNQVAPGWMISEDMPDGDEAAAYRAGVPLGRRGTDQDVANMVAFLASDLAAFVSGQFIAVSGGTVMPAI